MSSSLRIRPGAGAPQDDAVILAIGSNLRGGYPSLQALLEAAVSALPSAGLRVLARSRWWRSAAWPDPGAPDYLNGVVIVATALGPRETLEAVLDIERRFGRIRAAPNAPRTLDVDLIAHGRAVVDQPGLQVPHPRAHERFFVMGPLAEIAPGWRHPTLGLAAADIAAAAPIGRDAGPIR